MFYRIWSLIVKELIQLWRDKLMMLFVLLGPLTELLMVAWSTSQGIDHLPTAVLDLDRTAASRGLVDILQPDVLWAGGITCGMRICHIAEAAGLSVITHAGMNYPYGQHLAFAMPAIPWGERSEGVSPPGVPLEEMVALPGTAVIKDGYLVPSDAPGFGLEVTKEWLEDAAFRCRDR